MERYREEVLNVYLSELMQDRGIVSVPEKILSSVITPDVKMPDVMVDYSGLRVMIESKVADAQNAHSKALEAARNRIEQGIAQMGLAVVFPAALREAADIKTALAECVFDFAVVTESGDFDYIKGNIDELKNTLLMAFHHLVEEDVVLKAVAELDAGIERFSEALIRSKGIIGRFAQELELREPANIKDKLKHEYSVAHISGLVLTNAFIFQEILSENNNSIESLETLRKERLVISAFADHWEMILEDINYYPIFHIAFKLILNVSTGRNYSVYHLIDTAKSIASNKAALRHDLMGRVYHRLLTDSKYLGTYYTSIPAAVILLHLALHDKDWEIDWNNLEALKNFKIADLACGTGTLLMAAATAITDNYVRRSVTDKTEIEFTKLHKTLMESVIYGYDVLASAVHLTASTLAMQSLKTTFDKMNLFCIPLGGKDNSLGSIEFLRKAQYTLPGFTDVFGSLNQSKQVMGRGLEIVEVPRPPELDLCVMNPPFTRSVGGNLLFGSSPPEERGKMQQELRKLISASNIQANITAGLGSVFVAIGDKYLKKGGRIALVLPKALLSGVAWGVTRDLLNRKYQVETIIASQDPLRWNFSESTNLSEVLIVARKIRTNEINNDLQGKNAPDRRVVISNLWLNPQTSFEALAIVQAIHCQTPPLLTESEGTYSLKLGERKVGEAFTFNWDDLRSQDSWMLPCAFAQTDLIRVTYHLLQGKLTLPGETKSKRVNLTPLNSIGTLGPDRRGIHDGFELSKAKTPYAAFWGHKANDVYKMEQPITHYLSALAKAKNGWTLRRPEQLWPKAGKILLAEGLRFNTMKLCAIRLPKPALSNVWWSVVPKKNMSDSVEKAFTLWFNSTLGLLIFLSRRIETQGAWAHYKKQSLNNMPVLNIRKLSDNQIESLASVYDSICDESLTPFPNMANDPIRAQIDQAFAKALNLPDFSMIRELLAQEPVICLRQLKG